MTKRKEKPEIKVEIKPVRHPNAEVVTIALTGADAAGREEVMALILQAVDQVLKAGT
jgi:hypothetical protein